MPTSVWGEEGIQLMSTGRQVDHLFRAVAEARRLRAQDESRRAVESDVLSRDRYRPGDGFVTEWQSAEAVSAST